MNNTQFDRAEATMRRIEERLIRLETSTENRLVRLETKIDELLNDYEDETIDSSKDLPEDDLYTKGERVPYVKIIEDEQIREFRNFLSHIRMNESFYTEREIEFASYADKTFDDIRLSENSKRILESAYFKTFKRNWPFKFVRGYLHKFNGQKGWSWSDGSRG